tara:strand:+ start:63061 stop:63870 length:810 start_codon:yes stop_codon:yes gene_type:complete
MNFKGKTAFVTGSSRGIGKEIAMYLAQAGANVIITGKTTEEHPKLDGTIYTTQNEITALGGNALALPLDVRDEEGISTAMQKADAEFGGIDILVNNASAISLTNTLDTSMRRFDLIMGVNVRATYACSQAAIPYFIKQGQGQILTLSPPINLKPKWFENHTAYTISKYGMSMCVLGMAAELKEKNIRVNALWPQTTIATAAIQNHFPPEIYQASRKPAIMAKAALYVLGQEQTGQFFIDEEVLRMQQETDFSQYAVNSEVEPMKDLFLD